MSVIGANLTQTLYDQNLEIIKNSHAVANAFSALKSISGINAMDVQEGDMQQLMPAFVEQANLSTWYQSNPWQILTESSKYGIKEPLGGPLDLEQPPGYRPGNILINRSMKKELNSLQKRENFGNVGSSVEAPSAGASNSVIGASGIGCGMSTNLIILAVLLVIAIIAFFYFQKNVDG